MKTLTKTFGISFLFVAFMLVSNPFTVQALSLGDNSLSKASLADTTAAETNGPAGNEEFDYDFDVEDPFFFSEKVVVNVFNQQEELIFSKAFSKEEVKSDKELKAILKKSAFLLSVNNEYYYYSKD